MTITPNVPALDPVDATDWIARAAALTPPTGLFIGGEIRESATGTTRTIRSPRDGAVLAEAFPWAGVEDADAAVAHARKAFDEGPWPRMHPRERGEILQRFADLVDRHRADIALRLAHRGIQ